VGDFKINPGKMKKILSALLVLTTFILPAQEKKILIVATNRDTVGTHASGTYLPEIAFPFQYFIDHGYAVDIVTPKGGKAAIYKREVSAELEKIWKSELFDIKTTQTLSPAEAKANEYAGVFYPGGHGQYFDVVTDERIALLTSRIYEKGGTVGTAGHGAASLIDIRLSNGTYLVDGKEMTCFPHWAERRWMNLSDYGKLLPFNMEEVLARRGARLTVSTYETRSDPQMTLVIDAHNRIVTGSFASSAKWVAEQMVLLIEAKSNK
jgi:putative intracellular protease/amidase